MGYHLNGLDEPTLIAVSKPLLTEFGIHHRLESCDTIYKCMYVCLYVCRSVYPYLRGDTALELSGDDEAGEGLRTDPNPLDLCLWELMVLAMVILAACLARSVETKLLTRSFRLPLTSGLTRSSRLLPLPPPPLEDAWALLSPD